jgi:hypothetical protein
MGHSVLRTQLWCGMADEEVRDRPMKKTKFDKAMDEHQEVLYPVLVQFIKEDKDENKETDSRNT